MTYAWRELLYPAEWGFRFFIASMLVAIINSFSSTDYTLLYYVMWTGIVFCLLLQVRITILFMMSKIPSSGNVTHKYTPKQAHTQKNTSTQTAGAGLSHPYPANTSSQKGHE